MDWQELKDKIGDKAKEIIEADRGQDMNSGKVVCFMTEHKSRPQLTWLDDLNKLHCFNCSETYDIIDHAKWLAHDDMAKAHEILCGIAGVESSEIVKDKASPFLKVEPQDLPMEQIDFPSVDVIEDTLRMHGGHYLTGRGISKEALIDYRVTSNKTAIYFNYYIGETCVKIKGRVIGDIENGPGKYAPTPKGGSNVLYGQHMLQSQRILAVCEGEVDALSLHTALVENAMDKTILASSIPSGSNSTSWITNSRAFIDKFEAVVIVGDNDDAGKKFTEKAASELVMIVRVRTAELEKATDVNELLQSFGHKAVCSVVANSKDYLPDVTVDLSKIPEKAKHQGYERTGFFVLDKMCHGLIHGLITLFTGHTGAGKTTILRQMIIFNVMSLKRRIGVMMGEETPSMFRDMILRQAYLKSNPTMFDISSDEWDNTTSVPKSELVQKFNAEWHQHISSFNCGHLQDANRLKKLYEWIQFESSIYGTRLFIIDNLMKLEVGMGEDLNSKQGDIIDTLKNFASALNVHIILVAHPKKGESSLNSESISGSQKIANTVDNLVSFQRFDKMDQQAAGRVMSQLNTNNEYDNVTAFLRVHKNRVWAKLGVIAMRYDEHSNCINDLDPDGQYRYGWTIPGREIQNFE